MLRACAVGLVALAAAGLILLFAPSCRDTGGVWRDYLKADDELRGRALRTVRELEERHKGVPFEQWPEQARRRYEAAQHAIHDPDDR